MSGDKAVWRILDIVMIILIGLIGTVWGITERKAEKACTEVQSVKEFVAGQTEINKNMEKKLDSVDGKLDKIMEEMRKRD